MRVGVCHALEHYAYSLSRGDCETVGSLAIRVDEDSIDFDCRHLVLLEPDKELREGAHVDEAESRADRVAFSGRLYLELRHLQVGDVRYKIIEKGRFIWVS